MYYFFFFLQICVKMHIACIVAITIETVSILMITDSDWPHLLLL